ncbi:TonB-linked SusC/RagA family outer membrane protein [Gelidibacter sediminis]|uniref:TonB-linked SusC/RagA family outer membrane protein n=1 Tax=Gelidibacter sediminis TaxID=1608710 RepID=A0A4R7QAZ6_9FLAO|nr:SusC/RagA family TonB-linked outer membrane protein [Gelidibacter sediminis]TDU43950.1 TonB-linked SusC/RagA family outer membrane protein [Gelidibacter sediminis]
MKFKLTSLLTLLLAFVVQFSLAQEKAVSGTVTSVSDGFPLPGVNVLVKGTTRGVQTDFDGNYTINVSTGETLVFSFVSMLKKEVVVGASNTINVALEEDIAALDEVVVTGYASYRKSEVTGSTVQLGNSQLTDIITPTVDQALQGKVAGLTISGNSGTPGSTSNIRIRGISSITAGNEPLYVIDGVPMNNDNVSSSDATSFFSNLASFDSNNIETITVLKDASATAQYGARGANGVIVITTKGGKQGKTKYSFSTSYGVQNDAVDGPDPLTAANRLELASEAYFNDGFFATKGEAEAYLLAREPYLSWDQDGRPEGNWKEAIKNKDAAIKKYNLSASGGNENHTFYASLGYIKQEGTVVGSEFERINGAVNFSTDLSSKLKFSSNNTGAYTYQDAFLERSAYFEGARTAPFFLSPLYQPYNDDGSINEFGGSLPNPLYISKHNIDDNTLARIVTNNQLSWDIGHGFSASSRFNIDYQVYNTRSYSNRNYGYGAATDGDASQYSRNTVTYTFQNQLNYNFDINVDHVFDVTLLQEYSSNRAYFLGAYGENFADDGLNNLDSLGNPVSINSSFYDSYLGAYLGSLHYSAFQGKYVVDLNYRYEGNSRFSPEQRWGSFWSVGGAWNIHKEDFMASTDWLNNLKLRASYGVTGNANIGLNNYQSLFSFGVDYNGEGAQSVNTFGNKDLSWEKSNTLDLGLDFGLFSNVVSGTINYYRRESTDLLLNVPLSQTTGFASQVQNIGALENSGLEVELNFDIVRSEDFNFSLGGNLGTVKNEITKLPLDPNGIERTITTTTTRIETGHPVRGWYMPTWAGVNPQTGLEEYYVNGVDGATTTNFNEAADVWQGDSALPKITAGLNLHVDFKGFFLDANGYYAGGHKIYEGWHRYTNTSDGYPIFAFQGLTTLLDRWQQPGDVARNGKFTSSYGPWERHSKYLYDGDFFRLRSMTLGYNFKDKFESIGITNMQIYLRGNNLATWVKDDNLLYDPEVSLGGETGLETPATKSYSLGLTINF